VATGDKGITKAGEKGESFQSGIEIVAKQTIFAEGFFLLKLGSRGSLTERVIKKYDLRKNAEV
jgi:electron-transferring-flavoprotein dehydrogenase